MVGGKGRRRIQIEVSPFIYNKAKVDTLGQEVSENGLACEAPLGVISSYCNSQHKVSWDMRCRKCKPCTLQNLRAWVAKAIYRFEYNCSDVVREVYLWTFGTSLSDNLDNRLLIREYWTLFRKRINSIQRRKTYQGKAYDFTFNPLFRVVEAGSKGNRLHVHVVNWGHLPQELGKRVWRSITTEESNVNFSPPNYGFREYLPVRAIAYCAKYLGKSLDEKNRQVRNWYWMGLMLKKLPPKAMTCRHENLDKSICGDYLYKYVNEVFGETEHHNHKVQLVAKVQGDAQTYLKSDWDSRS